MIARDLSIRRKLQFLVVGASVFAVLLACTAFVTGSVLPLPAATERDAPGTAAFAARYLPLAGIALLGVLALAFVWAGVLHRLITARILRLADVASQITAESVCTVRARVECHDEIGRLVEVFNGMLDQIQARNNELQRRRAHLEQEIVARTLVNAQLEAAKRRAEAANRARSEFLANVSHEIRMPMNGIIGMTELVLDTDLTGDQREFVGLVKTSADALLRVINDILDFSQIDAGRFELDRIDFSLRTGVETTLKTLALRAHQKGLELVCDIDDDVPDGLCGDPLRLRQVIVNLAGNAIKYTEAGEIVVRVEPDRDAGDPGALHFFVRDTGIGIPKSKQAVIFEAFTQVDGSSTRKYGGTGLGLAICSRLVALFGGRIWVESEPGRGSTFHFTARFGLAAATGQERPSPARILDLRDLPVLVVDDNATNRRLVEAVLRAWHMRPTLVESGQRALEVMERAHAQGERFPLVLLDVNMPGMDGFTLAAHIKHHPELAEATVLMLTSSWLPGDTDRCREVGVSAYLVKPVTQPDLFDAIMTALQPAAADDDSDAGGQVAPVDTGARLRVLLAEDNPVNQNLAARLLRRQGHDVVVVDDGTLAVGQAADGGFDLVFMDVQMPGLGGFEATAAIRNAEAGTGRHVPIVAMTAHAMKGDRERCLAAGMDDYLPKPVQAQSLRDVIGRLTTGAAGKRADVVTAESATAEGAVFDRHALEERVDGDRELMLELIGIFLDNCDGLLDRIRNGLTTHDCRAVEEAAHSLKGSIGTFCAPAAHQSAFAVERLAHEGKLEEAGVASVRLASDVHTLCGALSALPHEDLSSAA